MSLLHNHACMHKFVFSLMLKDLDKSSCKHHRYGPCKKEHEKYIFKSLN